VQGVFQNFAAAQLVNTLSTSM